MSHIFISYSRKDFDFASKIVQALATNKLDTWIDWKSIPKGEDWEQEIYRGIEEAEAFLFLISPDSVASQMCNKEIAHAVKNGKRILPIVIRDTDPKIIHPEISKRNWIFCRDGQDDFNQAIEETRNTIHTDYEWLKYHTELQVKALKWEQKKDNSRLLRGKELREAEQQFAEISSQEDPQPTKLQREYILASQRNEIRTRRQITIGLVIGLAIMIVLSFVAWGQRNSAINAQNTAIAEANARATAQIVAEEQKNVARAGEIAAQSLAQRDSSFDLSLLLSVEAFHAADTAQSRNALLTGTQYNPQLLRYLWADDSKLFSSLQSAGIPLSIAFSVDGKTLASSNRNGFIVFWDVVTYQPIGHLSLGESSYANSIAFSPDGKILASGNNDGSVILWDVTTFQPIGEPLREHTDSVSSVAFSPDGKTFVSGSTDRTFILWDVVTRRSIGEPIKGQMYLPFILDFSPDGETLIAAGVDGGISLLNFAKQQQINFPLNNEVFSGNIRLDSLSFSPDGQTLALGSTNGLVFLWSLTTHGLIGHPLVGHTNSVQTLAFSPDGKILASGGADDIVMLWNVETQEPISEPLKGLTSSEVSGTSITNITFSPDGKMLASSSSNGDIIFWSLISDQSIGQTLGRHIELVLSVAFNPNGKLLASGSYDHTIILWDVDTRRAIGQPLVGHSDIVGSVAFSPDGKILASGSCGKVDNQRICNQGEIILWDIATRKPIGQPFIGNTGFVNCIAFSPDGKTIASGSADGKIIIWDLTSRQPIGPPLSGMTSVSSVAFSPDGKTIAAGTNNGSTISWNLEDNRPIGPPLEYVYSTGVNIVAFSPDGKTLASETFGSRILFLDPTTLKRIGETLTGQTNNIYSIAFSPDSKILASGSYDKTIVLWDVVTRQAIGQPLIGHTDGVTSVAFSPEGKILASGSYDKTIILWPADPLSWVELNCQRAGRNFTQNEWTQYFPNEPYHSTCVQWPAGQ